MPRTYKPKLGTKIRRKHDKKDILEAVAAVEKGLSYRKAEEQFGIPRAVIQRHAKDKDVGSPGRPVAIGRQTEEMLVKRLVACGEWGYPMDCLDLRLIVKGYLDRRGMAITNFKDNMPGDEWAKSFLKRHKERLTMRMCQNIKRSHAAVSPNILNQYFDNLESTIDGVPASNLLNYDETNLADDPGRKKVIFKRGTKYPERIMDSSKSAVSLMYAACADGTVLPPYVVYKALHLYDTWTQGGPKGARYNRSKSGWFDIQCFADWFEKVALPHLKGLPGKKVMLGDNLSSHLSTDVIKMCEDNDIHFCFLPPNSTHMVQPLDVAFFRPMKVAWRKILEKWKKTGAGRKQASIPKEIFPSLLRDLTNILQENAGENIRAGFEKCGIVPVNREKVISRLPKEKPAEGAVYTEDDGRKELDESFTDLLREMRYDAQPNQRKRKRRIDVQPGRSVTGADFPDDEMPGPSSANNQGDGATNNTGVSGRRQDTESDESMAGSEGEVESDNREGDNIDDEEREDATCSSDSDDEPLIEVKKRSCLSDVKAGDYVLFEYGDDVYPGIITAREERRCSIKAMEKSGWNWKWPRSDDILSYPMEDVKQRIDKPKELHRGILEVKELKWHIV